MDLALKPRLVSSAAFAYLCNTLQLDNPPGFFYLHVEQFVFVFVFLFLWPGAIGEV
jgi:hypothetical protein